jgi:hypothetical protein
MSLIQSALEECASCNSNKYGYSEVKQGQDTNGRLKDGFTYDDSKGIKDSVILTGPLSEVYTKALNITLRKTPLIKPEEDTPDLTTNVRVKDDTGENPIIGTEALKEEDDTLVVLNLLKDKLSKEEATEVDENYEFTTLASDPSNVVANIAVMTASDAIRPEIVDKIQSYKETNANHDTILVVSVPTNSGSEGTKVYQKLINLNPSANVLGNDAPQLEKAFESLYERNGIKVFYGAEGLIEAISYIGRNL